MKTLKTLLSVLAVAAVFSAGAYAQDNADISANATVVGSFSVNATQDLNFGQILAGSSPSVSATDSANAGWVQFTGASSGSTIDITITYPTELSDGGSNTMTFTPSNFGISQSDGSAPLDGSLSDAGATETGSLTVDAAGSNTNFFVSVGGALTVGASQAEGTYTGTINIEADYQ